MFHAFRQAARRASSKSNEVIPASIANSSLWAVATVLAALASQSRNEIEQDAETYSDPSSSSNTSLSTVGKSASLTLKSIIPIITSPSTCQCELSTKISRLRRSATSKLMAAEATHKTFFSLYEVDFDHPLGQGAYGDVYLCREISTGEECALKKIPKVCDFHLLK